MAEKAKKKLPKRCSNAHAKARRAESWARGRARKAERRAAQDARAVVNREKNGG